MSSRRRLRPRAATSRSSRRSLLSHRLRRAILWVLIATLGIGALYGMRLDATIRHRFEGRRWALPSRVFARALELYPGAQISVRDFERELLSLGYRTDPTLAPQATYRRTGEIVDLHARPFSFWDGEEPERWLSVTFAACRIVSLRDSTRGKALELARLEPPQIGSFYPDHREDRDLVRLEQVPPLLPAALQIVEDRHFRDHYGVDPRGIVRALLANLRAGRVVQGGSTLTQQLVKNYFLSSERTVWRKATEAAMAVLLELRYSKDEILQAYLNEIYLGQQAERAIHGVGLASRFYFGLPVEELDLPKIALLVGMVRGPSLYDPRRNPDRARERRNQVIQLLAEQGAVSRADAEAAQRAPLGVIPDPPPGNSPHPAFLELVRRQLREDYRERDLQSEGLRIFTTLDPHLQRAAENALINRVGMLEHDGTAASGPLQGAAVVTQPQTGEILALVGGREVHYAGFNRALDARRPIGSLVKPAVFLTALEEREHYTLATLLDDSEIRVPLPDGSQWSPANSDHRAHGAVTLYQTLVHSLNLATAHLGMEIGVERVVRTLHRLGVSREIEPYPALLLGALELSPLEVAQLYQTLADGGAYTSLRAVREVLDASGHPLQRYPLQIRKGFDPAPVFLINHALAGVVEEGTAKSLRRVLPEKQAIAGKTGTTDDLRDSWFVGYTADWLGVVWLGMDDNRPCGLSGASGALQVWGDLFVQIGGRSFDLTAPVPVEYAWVDRFSGERRGRSAENAVRLPFLRGTAPALERRGLWHRFTTWLGDKP